MVYHDRKWANNILKASTIQLKWLNTGKQNSIHQFSEKKFKIKVVNLLEKGAGRFKDECECFREGLIVASEVQSSNPPAVSLQQMKLLNLYIKRAQTSTSNSSSSSDISSY